MHKFFSDKKRLHLYTATMIIAAAMPLVPAVGATYEAKMLDMERDLIEMQNANDQAVHTENLYRMSVITRRTAEKAKKQNAQKVAKPTPKSTK